MDSNLKVIGGLYRIEKRIGGGGMSDVFLGCNIRLNKKVAVKRVLKHQSDSFDLLAEENILKRIDHPYIVRITDIIEDPDYLYIIEDFVEGETMQQIINEKTYVSEETALEWFKDLCSILIYLHSQNPPIIYRDMKPGNIMIQKSGHPKLIDFGISREFKKGNRFDTSMYLTPGFAAPEQYKGIQTDARTDIYGLGMTMHYLVTGKAPSESFSYQSASVLNPNISEGFSIIIDKCVRENPSDRYQDARDLLYDLKHIEMLDSSWQKYVRKKNIRKQIPRWLLMSGILLILAGVRVQLNHRIEVYNGLVQKAEKQDSETALKTLRQAEKVMPESAGAYVLEANIHYQQSDYQQVIELVSNLEEKKIVNREDNPEIYNVLGASYYELQDYDQAVKIFASVSGKKDELSVANTLDYAAALGKQGKTEQAQEILEKLKTKTAEPYLSYLEGELFYLKKEYPKAAEKYKDVIESDKDESLSQKAVLSLAETYRDSISLNSDDESYIDDADTKEINLITNALQQGKSDYGSYIYELLGQAYYQKGVSKDNNVNDLKASIQAFQKEISMGVKKAYLYGNIYKIYNILEDYTDAEKSLVEYEKAFPNDYLVNVYRAENEINIQFAKPDENYRDFSKVLDEYQKAEKKVKSSDDTEELKTLEGYINELKEKGWL